MKRMLGGEHRRLVRQAAGGRYEVTPLQIGTFLHIHFLACLKLLTISSLPSLEEGHPRTE